jgi:hypothetical protein
MTLELEQVAARIIDMAANYKASMKERNIRLNHALTDIHNIALDQDNLKSKIDASKTSWLIAGLHERIDFHQLPIQCPHNYQILASDGSHIDVDRHYSARCFLINIGLVKLQYGDTPEAMLSSKSQLYFMNDEVNIYSSEGRQFPIEGQLLGMKRTIEECHTLVDGIHDLEGNLPLVLLLDGSLVLWGTGDQNTSDFINQELVANGFLKCLDTIHELSRDRELSFASYISFPRSTDVINALRLAACPYEQVNCDSYCGGNVENRACDIVEGLLDRDLFRSLLNNKERSALFTNRSSVVKNYYGEHSIYFFYLKLDNEVVRIEVPLWVASNNNLVNLLHVVIIDQCSRGFGYPVALSEAHEKAVVTGSDREGFWQLVEQIYSEDDIYLDISAKQRSKRTKWI